jgi:ABC-type transport system involved in multi-copper enzyme maturation permease subunit
VPQRNRREWLRKAAARVSPAISAAIEWIGRAEPVYGVAGPIFEKELRVAGRRRRYYVLRVVYLAVLSGLVGLLWLSLLTMPYFFGGRQVFTYGMSYAGGIITSTILWAELLGLPLIALVMLSTSIGDEVYHRTLGVLMTTPINSLHIVLGKFLGKMTQLVLLLAVSLPILLVVRVLGGTPLEYVLAGTGITLTAMALAGALSMFFSISSRVVPVVLLKALVAMLALYVLVPIVWVSGLKQAQSNSDALLYYTNPYLAMGVETSLYFSPAAAGMPVVHGWLHCLVMLGLTALVLAVCMLRVRRAALRQLTGETGWWRPAAKAMAGKRAAGRASGKIRPATAGLRRVRGSPIVWKEARTRIFKRRWSSLLGLAGVLAVMGVTYWLTGPSLLTSDSPHLTYGIVLFILGGLATSVITATGIPVEKESGAWALLLTTPLEGREILLGKAIGGLRRSLPAWLPLFLHLGLFTALGAIHPVVLPLVAMVVFGNACFLTGSGLFWGVVLKRTATAAIANLLVAIGLWFIVPMGCLYLFGIAASIVQVCIGPIWPWLQMIEGLAMLHPFVEIGVILNGAAGGSAHLRLGRLVFHPAAGGVLDVGIVGMTLIVLALMAGYTVLGRLIVGLVMRGIRKSAF